MKFSDRPKEYRDGYRDGYHQGYSEIEDAQESRFNQGHADGVAAGKEELVATITTAFKDVWANVELDIELVRAALLRFDESYIGERNRAELKSALSLLKKVATTRIPQGRLEIEIAGAK